MIETTDFNNLAEIFEGLKPEDINRLADEFLNFKARMCRRWCSMTLHELRENVNIDHHLVYEELNDDDTVSIEEAEDD